MNDQPPAIPRDRITGVILAGGEGRRMDGRDKGLVAFRGRPLIEHALAALSPQVGTVVISANRNLERYAQYGVPVVSDEGEGFRGPLAGVAAVLKRVETPFALTVPCDAPRLPPDLAARLAAALVDSGAEVAVPDDGEYRQYAFALMRREVGGALNGCLAEGCFGLGRCYSGLHMATADFTAEADRFVNLNTESEKEALERAGEQ